MGTSYKVVTNNFIATPRDGYYEFGNIPEELIVDTYVEYAQSFVAYAKSVGTLEPVPADRASTQVWKAADAEEEPAEEPEVAPTAAPTAAEVPVEEPEPESESNGNIITFSSFAFAVAVLTTLIEFIN